MTVLMTMFRSGVRVRVDLDDRRALQHRLPEVLAVGDGVLLAGVRPLDPEDVGRLAEVGHAVGHRAGAQARPERPHGRCVAHPGAVVDVVGAVAPGELLEEVVLLVHHLRGAEKAHRVGAVFGADALQLVDDAGVGLLPGGLAELAVLLYQWGGQAVLVVDDLRRGAALDADAPLVDRRLGPRHEAHVAGLLAAAYLDSTADTTVRTDGLDRFLIFTRHDVRAPWGEFAREGSV